MEPLAESEPFLITARWVLPVTGPPIEDGAVLVRGDRIAAVGRGRDIGGRPEEGRGPRSLSRLDLGDAALLPGLVNAHTHLELTILRGRCEEVEFFPWIRRVTEARFRKLEAADLVSSARWGALEAVRGGVTTVADTGDAHVVLQALADSGLRGIAYQEVFGPDERECHERLKALETALDAARGLATPRARVGISPHAPYTVSAALFREAARLALERRLPMAIHAAESRAERDLLREGAGPFAAFLAGRGISVQARGVSTLRHLADNGVLEARPLLIHAVHTGVEDWDLIRDSGCSVAHCPKSNAKLCHGIAPVLEWLARGLKVGLGTDGPAGNNGCDLLEEARFGALLQRARPGASVEDIRRLDARAVVRLLTLGGAEALGLDAEVGSLEPGKLADLTAVRLAGPQLEPGGDPETTIVFAASARDVVLTVVGGRVLFHDGRVATIDEDAARAALQRAAVKLGR
ncbi:MAG: amidohydrolase family protein [Planctomycetes bacterium]|nr:amidohydrolase family protein [Planctomycetota bacterium]